VDDHTADATDLPFDPATGDVVVWRDPASGGVRTNIPLWHAHHSPTGVEIGYGGSGPADFALNVLAAVLPAPPPTVPVPGAGAAEEDWIAYDAIEVSRVELRDGTAVSSEVWGLHQDFKWAFVALLPQEGGVIPGAAIRAWLRERGALPAG